MATKEEKDPEMESAFAGQANPYAAVAQEELDTSGSDWGGLLGFLAGAGAALAALPTGGASLAAIPAVLGAGAATAELGSGIGGLADDDPRAGQRMISGAQNVSKSYKDKAFTGKK
tara:strand:- start:302 stop:649 length:348 start_codon:yes stop_codon:yes gene_type:complete